MKKVQRQEKKTIVPFTDDLITTKGTGKRKQIYDSTTLYIKRNLFSSHFVFGTNAEHWAVMNWY